MAVIDLDVRDRFYLSEDFKKRLREQPVEFGFGLLGSAVYMRTYSRIMDDGRQERWADTVIRVVEGNITIRKWWTLRNFLKWDEFYWSKIAEEMADSLFNMRFMPGGRHLYQSGTELTYLKGGMSINNCSAVSVKKMSDDVAWAIKALMVGTGVGFDTHKNEQTFNRVNEDNPVIFQIPDTREGWAEAVRRLILSYEEGSNKVEFDYSIIRPAGAPIKTFGGTASGPEPLEKGIEEIRSYFNAYLAGRMPKSQLILDVMCSAAGFVVAGGSRRSALLALGSAQDENFLNYKNYEIYPDRAPIGWSSNNSIALESHEDFKHLPAIADNIRHSGEPGIVNVMNMQKYGRYGEKNFDRGTLTNPCSEIVLEDKELCLLTSIVPMRCVDSSGKFDENIYYRAAELASIYASTASLLPTDSEETNAVVARNHRIGVSISGFADWMQAFPANNIITWLDKGYKIVKGTNIRLAKEAGIPASIRVTCEKPEGTTSLLVGASAGMHLPSYSRYIRRMRVSEHSPIVPVLVEAGVPHEPDDYSAQTLVFEFPVDRGNVRGQRDVSVWAKAQTVVLLQRFWSDNMVSNTCTFDLKKEGGQIEDVLTFTAPFVKSLAFLPLLDEGSMYTQLPEEETTKADIEARKKQIKDINWDKFSGSDGQDSKFCNNDVCEL